MFFGTPNPVTVLDFFDGRFTPEDRPNQEIHYFRICIQEKGKMPCTCAISEDAFSKLTDSVKGSKISPVGELTQRGKFRIVDFEIAS